MTTTDSCSEIVYFMIYNFIFYVYIANFIGLAFHCQSSQNGQILFYLQLRLYHLRKKEE